MTFCFTEGSREDRRTLEVAGGAEDEAGELPETT